MLFLVYGFSVDASGLVYRKREDSPRSPFTMRPSTVIVPRRASHCRSSICGGYLRACIRVSLVAFGRVSIASHCLLFACGSQSSSPYSSVSLFLKSKHCATPKYSGFQRLFRVRLRPFFPTTVHPSGCTSSMTTFPSTDCGFWFNKGSTVSPTLPFPPAPPIPPLVSPRARVFRDACVGLMSLFGPGDAASPCSALAQFISTLAALMTLGKWSGAGARGTLWTSVFQRGWLVPGLGCRWSWDAMIRWRQEVCSHVRNSVSSEDEVRVVPARLRRDEVSVEGGWYLMNAVVCQ